jgi:AraC-like DNA-binding protein
MPETPKAGGARRDVLSDVLRVIRLSGAVLFRSSFTAPWSLLTGGGEGLLGQFPSTVHRLCVFHIVVDGHCWVRQPNDGAMALETNEAVVVPRCDPHVLCDDPERPPVPTQALLRGMPMTALRDIRYGGGGECTQVLCGFLSCEQIDFEPLYAALPPLFRVSMSGVRGLLDYAVAEAVSETAGSASSRLRVAELLFVEALRRYMADLAGDETGWLAGLRDPLVGKALTLLHDKPAHRWTVAALASETASSRSSLTARFAQLLSEPPMQYLARWRLLLAARQLHDNHHNSIAEIAAEVGYDSPAAFQRAFKRQFGETPAVYRKRRRAPAATSTRP